MYAPRILESTEDQSSSPEAYIVLQYFNDVFIDEVSRLSPKRDIDFSINLMYRVVPVSKASYRMITLKLLELKMQLQ